MGDQQLKSVLFSISARKGSKGVPGKNLRKFGSESLIEIAIHKAKKLVDASQILFSSDSEDMLEVANKNGCTIIERERNLAGDDVSLHQVTKRNIEIVKENGNRADIVVQLAPTCPFLKTKSIEEAINKVHEGYTSSIGLCKISHSHPYRARVRAKDGSFVNYVQDVDVENRKYHSRQNLPELWCTTGGLYVRSMDTLENMDEDSFGFGRYPYGVQLDDIESINIDSLIDWEFALFIKGRLGEEVGEYI